MVRKMIALLVALSLMCMKGYGLEQGTSTHQEFAEKLKGIGLFQGTTDGFELDRAPTKIEAAVMLIRLLGKEELALQMDYPNPFTDVPAWADSYIGYMYKMGLTKGISPTEFGAKKVVDSNTYTTFVLRALGYEDTKGDFSFATATDTAFQNNILSQVDIDHYKESLFTRDDLVNISYNALNANLNNQTQTLAGQLIEDGVIDKALCQAYGITENVSTQAFTTTIDVYTKNNQLTVNLSKDLIPEVYRSQFSTIGGLTSNSYKAFTEEEYYLSIIPEWIYPAKIEKREATFFADGYYIVVFYDQSNKAMGYINISNISKAGIYKLPYYVWDSAKYVSYNQHFTEVADNAMKNAKLLDESVLQFSKVGNSTTLFIDFEKAGIHINEPIYVITGMDNTENLTPRESALKSFKQRAYLAGGTVDWPVTYNDMTGCYFQSNYLNNPSYATILSATQVYGYFKFPSNPVLSSQDIYDIEISSSASVSEELFKALDVEVYLNQVLKYHVRSGNLYDAQNNLIFPISSTYNQVTDTKGTTSVYTILGLHIKGGSVEIKLSGDDAKKYTVKW